MEAHEAFDLVKQIAVRMKQIGRFVDESVERAYFEALIEHDIDAALPIVGRMLEQNREPWTSTELARVIYRSRHKETSAYEPREDTRTVEELRQTFRVGILSGAEPGSWFYRFCRRRWAGDDQESEQVSA